MLLLIHNTAVADASNNRMMRIIAVVNIVVHVTIVTVPVAVVVGREV